MSDKVEEAGGTSPRLDTLLRAVETMPGIDAAPWDLDSLRLALRIARSTEAPDDAMRADLALAALSPDSRSRLLRHVGTLAQQRPRQSAPPQPVERQAVRLRGLVSAVLGRPATGSGATARDRLRRDLAGRS